MMDRLIVKNFGPLKDVDIELKKINLFIGENGSGKSVLGKLVTILTNLRELNRNLFFKKIDEYNIDFISNKSIVEYRIDNEVLFLLENRKIVFGKTYQKINSLFEEISLVEKESLTLLDELKARHSIQEIKNLLKKNNIKSEYLWKLLENRNEKSKSSNKFVSQYIPAERNLISLFNKYITIFITADIPLPKFLLNFSSEYTRAREEIKSLNFLNVEYQLKNGQEHIFYRDEESLLLEQSSSGVQSALPLYLTVKYFAQKHKSIIIEEPEQNLFPKAQAETIRYIVEQISDENSLFLMTHSPYVLSTLNILMMAHKAGNLNEVSKTKVTELYNEKEWINPNDFSAYYLENGVARDIKGRTGLISENEIDEISDNIQGEFEELLAIYREHKNDK